MPGAEADSSMRGAIQRLPSGEVDADATRGLSAYGPSSTPDHRGSLEGDLGSKDTSVEEAEKSVGSMTLNDITEENRTSSLLISFFPTYSHCKLGHHPPTRGVPGTRIQEKESKEKVDEEEKEEEEGEEDDKEDFQLDNARPPSHIDLHSTSPAPELPTRSPLRSGFRARGHSESEGAINDADQTQRAEKSSTASSHDVERRGRTGAKAQVHADESGSDEHNGNGSRNSNGIGKASSSPSRSVQPQPQPQPTLNATPTHAHVKGGAGVSIGGPIGMMRSPGVEERMAAAGDVRDAQEQDHDHGHAHAQEQGQKQRTESDERQTNTSAHAHGDDDAHGHGNEDRTKGDGEDGDVDEDDSYVDASADFAAPGEHPHPHPHPEAHSSTSHGDIPNSESEEHEVTGAVTGRGGGGKDKDKDKEEKRKSGGLISKMRRTLSRATNGPGSGNGRHVS